MQLDIGIDEAYGTFGERMAERPALTSEQLRRATPPQAAALLFSASLWVDLPAMPAPLFPAGGYFCDISAYYSYRAESNDALLSRVQWEI